MQQAALDGAIIVTTPHSLSLVDVARGILMFEKVNVPVLGIVENMSYFLCDNCDKKHYIFKSGGGKILADTFKIPFIGEIPIIPDVGTGGDSGVPILLSDPQSPASVAYTNLAGQVAAQLSIQQAKTDKAEATFDLAWKE